MSSEQVQIENAASRAILAELFRQEMALSRIALVPLTATEDSMHRAMSCIISTNLNVAALLQLIFVYGPEVAENKEKMKPIADRLVMVMMQALVEEMKKEGMERPADGRRGPIQV